MFRWLTRTRGEDSLIDTLIKPPVVKFTGTDEALRQRTARRRQQAAVIREDALKVDTKDDTRTRVRIVGER